MFTIRHPLLVFDRVHRFTGALRRTCRFTNTTAEALDLDLAFDFAEHGWVQVYADTLQGVRPARGGLRLAPGENEVTLSLNTDSFHFPTRSFRGRLAFTARSEPRRTEWIEIHFDEVRDLEPLRGFAAIDLGTSTSTVSLYHLERDAASRSPRTPALEPGDDPLPSAVYVRNFARFRQRARSACSVGSHALTDFRDRLHRDPRSLQLGIKRLVDSPRVLVTDESGAGGFTDPLEVLHVLGRHVREATQSHPDVQARLDRVSVTYPPTWSYRQLARWRDLFRRLGFADEAIDTSLDEASAAGLFYLYRCLTERDRLDGLLQDLVASRQLIRDGERQGERYTLRLLSFDFGGGTMDLALIVARIDVFSESYRLRLDLEGSDSLEYGGDQVTLAIFRMLKRKLALALTDRERLCGDCGLESEEAPDSAVESMLRENSIGSGGRNRIASSFELPDRLWGSWSLGPLVSDAGEVPDPARELIADNWSYLRDHLERDDLEERLEDAVDEVFPTRFLPSPSECFRAGARRNFDWLWGEAEFLKKRLFNRVRRETVDGPFPDFGILGEVSETISLGRLPDARLRERLGATEQDAARTLEGDCESSIEKALRLSAAEVYRAIERPLRDGLRRARQLVGERGVERVVLSGQSSRIPVVRWLFAQSRSEGGLGIPASKVEFDEENAKNAVSRGACLLQVLREALVGFEVDVSGFRANLLEDIFYIKADGSPATLFAAGRIDDFAVAEVRPESGLPAHLSIFSGEKRELVGQFDLAAGGAALPADPDPARELPDPAALASPGESDSRRQREWLDRFLAWTEPERIAFLERSARRATSARSSYRFYLTRSQRLLVVRDRGGADRRLFELQPAESEHRSRDSRHHPFSGVH